MTRQRRCWALVLITVVGGGGSIAACSFPAVTFAPDDAGDATTTDAPSDDAFVGDDGAGGDDATSQDGGGTADAAPDAPVDPCDQDHDGYKNPGCGGNDCDDLDPRVNPGAGFRTDIPKAPPWGDWNCDGVVEPQYPAVTCGLLNSCNSQGFDQPTGCGINGHFILCSGVLCPAVDAGSRVEGCR